MKDHSRTLVMGIVNVTPDSFSDGGRFFSPEEAARRARNLEAEGADVIDLGAESTRPGATPLGWQEEWSRLEPVLERLDGRLSVPFSVDTYHPETAERALEAGARIINCVAAESVPDMARLAEGRADVELVIPSRARALCPAGLRERVYLDPLIGFGTTREEDLALLRAIPELTRSSRVLLGVSRKRIVRKLMLGDADGERDRQIANRVGKLLGANLALAVWAALNGVRCVRVHDVAETVQALRVVRALVR